MKELAAYSNDECLHVLKFLEQLGLCYKLKGTEIEHYGQKGYLFNSLRPRADMLQIPLENHDHRISWQTYTLGCFVIGSITTLAIFATSLIS